MVRARHIERRAKRRRPFARALKLAGLERFPPEIGSLLADLAGAVVTGMVRIARSARVPLRLAEALLLTPEQLELLSPTQRALMREAGLTLRDLREVAGLTLTDLDAALDLKDHSLLAAAERGTATLSFELILRLAGLLARHDPLPFIMKFTRAYYPELWKILEEWGPARVPIHLEREHQFLNIYRRHDSARNLSDQAFEEVVKFTQAAFELALQFALQHGKSGRRTGAKMQA